MHRINHFLIKMSNNIKDILKEATKDILSDESLSHIEKFFNDQVETKVALHVEKALNEQDADYSAKLEKLLEAIDNDHTNKLQKVYEAVCANHANKLKQVVEKYENALNNEAVEFKESVVNNLSKYIDLYIDEKIPAEAINEAVKNKRAVNVLNNLRSALSVEAVVDNKEVKEAVIDGKKQINEATKKLEVVLQENTALKSKIEGIEKAEYLSEKTKDMPEDKKEAILKILGNKNLEFVKENFDYTSKMFDKTEDERLETLATEAAEVTEASKVDRPVVEEAVVTESVESDPATNLYLKELTKY